MSLLSPEELARLASAESLFASPIPVQSVSSDEFMPRPQTPRQREFEARVKDMGARMAKDEPTVRRWGWAPLVSQAGLTLGLSSVVERAFPSFGSGFRSLIVATVAINEVLGPILFKLALDRTGETGRGTAHVLE